MYFANGWEKRIGEALCRVFAEASGSMTTIVLRPTNVYGPHDDFAPATSRVTAALIRKVVERHDPLEVWGSGEEVRDNFLHGGRYTDVLVMYRAFRKELVTKLDLTRTTHPYFEQEMVIRCLKHGLKVAEIPGDEPKRIGSERKMRVWYNGPVVLYGILKELFVHRVRRPRRG